MSEENNKTISVKIFNTEVIIPIFQSKELTLKLVEKLEKHMFSVYKEYQVFLTQMIAIRTAYDFLVSLELLSEELRNLKKNILSILEEVNDRINTITAQLDNSEEKRIDRS
ncbi:MAG: hypothetical protein N3G21_09370 [Candidatus Hydrogenedentes bacterium]|nr:hypothetical protein [Candidatus Hydrogenedentota bacterium]